MFIRRPAAQTAGRGAVKVPSGWTKEARLTVAGQSGAITGAVVLVNETNALFRQTANGGVLTDANAQDVRFELLSTAAALPWDLWHYDQSSGRIVAAFRVGDMSANTRADCRLLAGKNGATEQDMAGTWAGALAMWLGANGTNRQGTSSRDLTLNSVTADASEPWIGIYDGSNSNATLSDASFLNGATALTIEALVRADALDTNRHILHQGEATETNFHSGLMIRHDAVGYYAPGAQRIWSVNLRTQNYTVRMETAASTQTTSWQHVAFVWQAGSLPLFYADAVQITPAWVGRERLSDGVAEENAASPDPVELVPSQPLSLGGSLSKDPWDGAIAWLAIWPRALSSSEVSMRARNALEARRIYGISEIVDADPANVPVVAVPVEASASQNSSVDIDVAVKAVDPDDTPSLSATGTVTGSVTGASISSGLLHLTTGSVGSGTAEFTITGGSNSSTAKAYVRVPSAGGSVYPEPPNALRIVNVSNDTQLAGALASAQPGDHIVLAAGDYSGVTISVAGTSSNPIVVRAATEHGARFTGRVTLAGSHTWLYQLHFDSTDSYSLDMNAADGCIVRRSKFTRDNAIVVHRSRNCEIGYNLFELPAVARSTDTNAILINPRYSDDLAAGRFIENITIRRNLFTTSSVANVAENVRCRAIYVSTFLQPDYPDLNCTIEYNLFDSYGRGRVIYSKMGGITVQYNTIVIPSDWTVSGTMALVQRHDYGNTWQGNWIEGGGYVDAFDAASVWNGNKIVGDGSFRLFAGEGDPSALGSHVAANGHTFAWNEGTIKVGYEYYSGNGPFITAANNRIEAHTGPVELLQWQQNTTITSTSSYTQVVPVKLTRNDVGPDAP